MSSSAFRGILLVVVATAAGIFVLARETGGTVSTVAPGRAPSSIGVGTRASTTTIATVPTTPISQLSVLVVNGAGSKDSKLAGKTRSALTGLGYSLVKIADSSPKDAYAATMVWYIAGAESDARGLARALGLPDSGVAPLPPDPKAAKVGDARVVVALGPDAPGVAGTSAPTTTAKK